MTKLNPYGDKVKYMNLRRWDVGVIEIIKEMELFYLRVKEQARGARKLGKKKARPGWINSFLVSMHLTQGKVKENKGLIEIAIEKIFNCTVGFKLISEYISRRFEQMEKTRGYHPDRLRALRHDVFDVLSNNTEDRHCFAKQVIDIVDRSVQALSHAKEMAEDSFDVILEQSIQTALNNRIEQFCKAQRINQSISDLVIWCHNGLEPIDMMDYCHEMQQCCIDEPVKILMEQLKLQPTLRISASSTTFRM